jgi:hypothetical protein
MRFHFEDHSFMACFYRPAVPALQKRSLAACIAALLAVNTITASADNEAIASSTSGNVSPSPNGFVRTVTNCDDVGPGSLRDTVLSATGGDVIDLTQLTCSDITLLTGKIALASNDMTLLGPGLGPEASNHLTIHGVYDRIFDKGLGTLTISGLEITGGHYQGPLPRGGCISSQGSLVIEDSIISGCEVDTPFGSNAFAAGGAIYLNGDLWMHNSVVTNSAAYSATNVAYGGGVAAGGVVTIVRSTISDNKAVAPQAYAIGGGLKVFGFGDVKILGSTISGNEADLGGGMQIDTLGTSQIINSTLSGNYASLNDGAAWFSNSLVRLTNSTVTRNSSYAYIAGIYADQAITVQSSILADNRQVANYLMYDLVAPSIAGGANLIMSASTTTPSGTITECPRLAALNDNGGPTFTHAILPGSPGIDVGDGTGLTVDQRGGGYLRVMGANADIGAFEWQGELDDNIFKSALEIECDRYD